MCTPKVTVGWVAVWMLVGCTSTPADKAVDTDVEDSDTQEETDVTTTDSDDTGETDTGGDAFTVAFTSGRYKVDVLEILDPNEGLDLWGGPQPDNKIAALLALVSDQLPELPGDFGVDSINENIAELLDEERAIVLMEARHVGGQMFIDIVQGERGEDLSIHALPEFYDIRGLAVQQIKGPFTAADAFYTGPDLITIPIQFYANEPALQITAEQAYVEGTASAGFLDGTIGGALPVDLIMDDIVAPLIINFYGEGDTADGYVSAARFLVESSADVTLSGSRKAVSGAFRFSARANAWNDPIPPAP